VNVVNIGEDYDIGRSVRHCVCSSFHVCVCVHCLWGVISP